MVSKHKLLSAVSLYPQCKTNLSVTLCVTWRTPKHSVRIILAPKHSVRIILAPTYKQNNQEPTTETLLIIYQFVKTNNCLSNATSHKIQTEDHTAPTRENARKGNNEAKVPMTNENQPVFFLHVAKNIYPFQRQ